MDSTKHLHIRRARPVLEYSMTMTTSLRRFMPTTIITLLMVASVLLSGCRRSRSLVIETGNPLRFVVTGPGTLTHLQISGPDLQREPHPEGEGERLTLLKVYWELAPIEGKDRSLDQIGQITYGKVPERLHGCESGPASFAAKTYGRAQELTFL